MTNMTKHAVVLERFPQSDDDGSTQSFVFRDPDLPARIEVHQVDFDTWDELGRPDTVTVTVEPGDQLNG